MDIKTAKIGMTFFLASEVMFFAGLIAAYWILRASVGPWPPAGQPRLPVAVTGINTLILLASGVSMAIGRQTLKKGCQLCLVGWIGISGLLGTLFLGIQGYEWVRLIGFGMRTAQNIYGGLFYLIVGAHGVHVLAALIVLVVVFFRAVRHRYSEENPVGFLLCQIYWSFVVLLWPILYGIVYLA